MTGNHDVLEEAISMAKSRLAAMGANGFDEQGLSAVDWQPPDLDRRVLNVASRGNSLTIVFAGTDNLQLHARIQRDHVHGNIRIERNIADLQESHAMVRKSLVLSGKRLRVVAVA